MAPATASERHTGRKAKTGFAVRKTPPKVRGGEPKLMDIVEWADDGEPISRADLIIKAVRRNVGIAEAAKAAGLYNNHHIYEMLREGSNIAAERAAIQAKQATYRRMSKREEALWWFFVEVNKAMAEGEVRLIESLDRRANGEVTNRVITRELAPKVDDHDRVVYDDEGRPVMVEVKRTEKANPALPDTTAIMAMLRSRYPERWAGTDKLEVVGSGGGPIEHRVTHTVEAMESMLEKVAARISDPIDTSAAEIPPLTD